MEIDHIIPLKEVESQVNTSNVDLNKNLLEEFDSPTPPPLMKTTRVGSSYQAGSGTDTDDEDSSLERRSLLRNPNVVVSSRTLVRRNMKVQSRTRATSAVAVNPTVQINFEDNREKLNNLNLNKEVNIVPEMPQPQPPPVEPTLPIQNPDKPESPEQINNVEIEDDLELEGATCLGYQASAIPLVVPKNSEVSNTSEPPFIYINAYQCDNLPVSRESKLEHATESQIGGHNRIDLYKEKSETSRKVLSERTEGFIEDAVNIWEGSEEFQIDSDEESNLDMYFPTKLSPNVLLRPNESATNKSKPKTKKKSSGKKKSAKSDPYAWERIVASILQLNEQYLRKSLNLPSYLRSRPGTSAPTNANGSMSRPESYRRDRISDLYKIYNLDVKAVTDARRNLSSTSQRSGPPTPSKTTSKLPPIYLKKKVPKELVVKKSATPSSIPTTPVKKSQIHSFRPETANRLANPKSRGSTPVPVKVSKPSTSGGTKKTTGNQGTPRSAVAVTQTPRDQERLLTPTLIRKKLASPATVETPTQTPRTTNPSSADKKFPLVPKPKQEAGIQTSLKDLKQTSESSSDSPVPQVKVKKEEKKSKSLLRSPHSIKRRGSVQVNFSKINLPYQPSSTSVTSEHCKSVSFAIDQNIPENSSSQHVANNTNLPEDQMKLKKVKVHTAKSADLIGLSYRRKSSQAFELRPKSSKYANSVFNQSEEEVVGNESATPLLDNMITFSNITMITPTDPPMDRDYIDLNIIVRRYRSKIITTAFQ